MARSGAGGKKRGKDPEDDWDPDLIRALNHRVRRCILRLLHAADGPSSPGQLAEALDVSLSNVSYHVLVLAAFKAVKEVDAQQVRGSIKHFYVSTVEDNATIKAMLERTRETDEG